MQSLETQALIAKACDDARNKYAAAHVNAAHANLIAALIENPPPAFSLYPQPDQFDYAAQYLRKLADAFREVVSQVAREADANAHVTIFIPDGDDLTDLIYQLEATADDMRESAREDA